MNTTIEIPDRTTAAVIVCTGKKYASTRYKGEDRPMVVICNRKPCAAIVDDTKKKYEMGEVCDFPCLLHEGFGPTGWIVQDIEIDMSSIDKNREDMKKRKEE